MSSSSAAPSERIGRYDVFSEIASGGMASVFLGREAGLGGGSRPVAIKRLLPHVASEPEFVRMFLDEARLAKRIRNDHVVETLDIVSSAGELALVMEYVHGEALSKLLTNATRRGERVDPRVAIAIGEGILDGLHAAHEAQSEQGSPLDIVHRDVSPQNVLVGLDGIARVFDFGIAKAADRLHTTEDGSLKGKLAYMSPEQLETGIVDRRADIWAASVVIWEMLAGRRLFVADSQNALIHVVLTREVPPLASFGLPKALDEILARGLARAIDDRYPTARAMADDLVKVLAPAAPHAVAAWVARNASTELDARSRLIEAAVGFATAETPLVSGLTTDEMPALIEERGSSPTRQERAIVQERVYDDEHPTTAWKDRPPGDDDATVARGSDRHDLGLPPLIPDLSDLDDTHTHTRDRAGDEMDSVNDETRAQPLAPPLPGLRMTPNAFPAPAYPMVAASPAPGPIAMTPMDQMFVTAMPMAAPPAKKRSETTIYILASALGGVAILVLVIMVVQRNRAAATPASAPPSAPTFVAMPPLTPASPPPQPQVIAPQPLTTPTAVAEPTPTATANTTATMTATVVPPSSGPPSSTAAPTPTGKTEPRKGHARPGSTRR